MLRSLLFTALTMLSITFAQNPQTITVMSYNIHHGESVAGTLDLDAIASVIRAHEPDIVGLQEVNRHFSERSAFRDQAAELASRLGMNHCFGANLDSEGETPGSPRAQYGTALLSPHPLEACDNTLLPRQGEDEQRGLLGGTITLSGQTFRAYTTHLQHDSEVARLEQANAILAAISENAERTFLLGDLNATPDSPEISILTRRFADSWHAGHETGFTYPAEAPESRIDYVLATRDLRPIRATVPRSEVSDHLPVVAVFSLG